MQASLLPNGHVVGTRKASRQSLSQSPVLGRHGNKQRGAREMGDRSQREAGRCTIISDPVTCSGHDIQPCGHPVCFTDQRTQSLLSSSVPLTQTGSTSPHTHTQAHTLPPIHTPSHTLTHSSPAHLPTHKHRAYRSEDTGNMGTQGQCSHTRHVECVGTAQSPRWGQSLDLPHTGSHWDS